MNRWLCALVALASSAWAAAPTHLPGTSPAVAQEGRALLNAQQWDAFLLAQIETARPQRARFWTRDTTSPQAYAASVRPNRQRLAQAVGVIDARVEPVRMDLLASTETPAALAETVGYSVWPARWPVLDGVFGEGLFFQPKGAVKGFVVILPDADQSPEAWAGWAPGAPPHLAARLAASGVQVVVLTLASRASTFASDPANKVSTNQSHREWIYRQAAPVGRHIIGYEIQKARAAIDWFVNTPAARAVKDGPSLPVGMIGYGEGGLVAFYAAALDERIDAAWVGGYFQPRERVWSEPVYRNVWGLLAEFGDAEIASLVAPRALIIEACDGPNVPAPGPRDTGPAALRSASVGTLVSPEPGAVRAEWTRARALVGEKFASRFDLVVPTAARVPFGGDDAFTAFARHLNLTLVSGNATPPVPVRSVEPSVVDRRQERTVRELQAHIEASAALSDRAREQFFWSKTRPTGADGWNAQTAPLRKQFAEEFIGRFPISAASPAARSRLLAEFSTSEFDLYEVVHEVFPGVEAWGWLLLPKNLRPDERRPVVVCQHGANSDPGDLVESEAADRRAHGIYRAYAARLAARGFVVFAPSMPNSTGGEPFRQLQRKANPLRKSIFSLVVASQERLLQWLKEQPFVDPRRIGYYGMSYGGQAALRVPVVLEDFAAVVCSGHFNDFVLKMTSTRSDKAGALFNASPDMIEFNLANTFNHAEMAALIAPRPFMVEHGYQDRVSPTEWVGAEYAKVARLYFRLGIPERLALHEFEGGHTVIGTETFTFLHRVLNWPMPAAADRSK